MKYKKLKTTGMFLLMGLGGLHAQEAIPASGGEASGAGGTVSYSVGQVAYTTNSGSNGSVAQGVQQPYEISTTVGIEVKDILLELSVYPNPTTHFLNLLIENEEWKNLTYQLFDIQGNLLESNQLISNNTTIKMEGLPKSSYFLKVADDQRMVKTFKIIKN
jgi:hypothetical protein